MFPAFVDDVPTLTVPWLGLFGDEDGSIPVEDVEQSREALAGAPADTEIVRYADAGHGFHCDQRDAYHEDAARRSVADDRDHLRCGVVGTRWAVGA